MDELDIFKKQWKKEEKNLPRLEYDDIYKMILKRSSSAVKWIFIVSILELAVGILLPIVWHPKTYEDAEALKIVDMLSWIVYPLGIYFIYRFFKNYQSVSATSSVKDLLANIMKARKTVRLWIIINLVIAGVIALFMMTNALIDIKGGWTSFVETAEMSDYLLVFGLSFVLTIVIVGITLLIYLLLYGFLIRNLSRNYKELKKMEI